MDITLLCYVVTGCGLVFLALSLLLYAFGTKSRSVHNEPERVKIGKYVDLKTSSVFSVILLTAVLSALPLVLIYLKPDLVRPSTDYELAVHGGATLEDGGFAEAVDIMVVRISNRKAIDTLRSQTDEQGQFYVKIPHAKPDEEYRISWEKAGYATQNRLVHFNAYPCVITLTKGGDN